MSDPIEVDIELGGRTVHAANLYPPKRPGGLFVLRYTDEYLANPGVYSFVPQIPLAGGSFAGAAGLPGPMQDGAPDRWGRLIVSGRIGPTPTTMTFSLAFLTIRGKAHCDIGAEALCISTRTTRPRRCRTWPNSKVPLTRLPPTTMTSTPTSCRRNHSAPA